MEATLRQRDAAELDQQPSNTEQLFNWISQMRSKKIKYLRNRRRNIRVEAVLAYALSQAEQELRNKQVARIRRWQQLKKQMETINNNNAPYSYNENEANRQSYYDKEYLRPVLNSLDNFMSKLGEIKAPLQR